jgi:CheY-like chemotaxis protein
VYIVDDDPIHQRIVQIMIEKHKIYDHYLSFTNAQLALDTITENFDFPTCLPDVILLDLNMPVLDGWGFLERFKSIKENINKEIKIYIVSSSVDEKDILRSKAFSFVNGFISKPLSPDIIKSTL